MVMFCELSNVTCIFEILQDNNYGTLTNGSWGGIIGGIINGTYDTSYPFFNPTENRLAAIDFSTPIDIEQYVLVTRSSDVSVSAIDIMGVIVFDWSVWICLILFSFVIGLLFFISQYYSMKSNKKFYLAKICIDIFSLIGSQGVDDVISKFSARLLFLFWAVSVIVVNSIYSTFLVASAINEKAEIPFTNFASFVHCLKIGKCKFYLC